MKVKTYPDPVLSKRAKAVKRIDPEFLRFVDEMFGTMYEEHGVGLAAPQVGQGVRVCVINCTGEKDGEMVLVNPVIVEATGESEEEEGCLSVPGVRSNVRRFARVKVRAYNQKGEEVEFEAEGLLARAVQHELDHLDGRLFFQRLSEAARMTIRPQLRTLEAEHGK